MLRVVLLLLLCASAAGCSVLRDPRDAAWDPRGSRALMDQIPNWDDEALRVCAGHLPQNQRRPGQSGRC
jgi:hypothetical protein